MTAIRLARGFTGRSVVVKFAGCYHGHVDSLLAAAGSGVATFGLPDSAGVPASSAAETIVLPYNDLAAVEAAFAARGHEIACVITEAAAGNMGVVPPVAGFTEGLLPDRPRARRAARLRRGDDRLPVLARPGGTASRARMRRGHPTCSPSARSWVAASPRRPSAVAPTSWPCSPRPGPVYQAGTLSGNPVATAAGLATLRGCTPEVYERLDVVSRAIADAASRRGWVARGSRTPCSGPGRCSASSSARGRCATTTTPGPVDRRRSPRSSTRCSARASTCRRARSRRGSSAPRTTTRRSITSWPSVPDACRAAARGFATIDA